ncbi:MAG: glycogen/starch/alpha-glucan phosphorylase [Negativicutes bacterium]|nr:glycogen/starch/alpha-glucan phosphorylase [Negativicutes bacterium]
MHSTREEIIERFKSVLAASTGKGIDEATSLDKFEAIAVMVREFLSTNWVQTNKRYLTANTKQVYYFSLEFLLGRLLNNNLLNLNIRDSYEEIMREQGVDLAEIEQSEAESGLGNGGLGRLAACFLDSLASLGLPGHGNGIRYKHGMFHQKIVDGFQVELPDNWLKYGYAWEYKKPDKAVEVRFGGKVVMEEAEGKLRFVLKDYMPVAAVPFDVPVVGYRNQTVNTLRLWSAETVGEDFDLSSFNRGDYLKAVEYANSVEAISEILYPDDSNYAGRLLRLKQQYFFVSAGVQSIIRRFKKKYNDLSLLPDYVAIQINDTHPSLVIPELMRLMIDEYDLGWDDAWRITTNTVAYTNHTILPEALEKWPQDMIREVCPRVLMIIEEIDRRFRQQLAERYPGDWGRIERMAIIRDGTVHMAHMAVVGSFSVNGVAKIHSEILKNNLLKDFAQFFPYKFNNKTNGVTHRRFMINANPALTELINDTIGRDWIKRPQLLSDLRKYADDAGFQERFAAIKRENKLRMIAHYRKKFGIEFNPDSIFDMQFKRIHAYKRQLLNILHVMYLYNRMKEDANFRICPRTFLIGGKAAPSYYFAKSVINLINVVGKKINNDPETRDYLQVYFLENYNVSMAERIFPAADVSEQISTASQEASGTGNMKFMMNGAVTIGTMDGANIEIGEEAGGGNVVFFGLTAEEVLDYYAHGGYSAWEVYHNDWRVKQVVDQLTNGFYINDRGETFHNIRATLLDQNDQYFVLKDFAAYIEAQEYINNAYSDRPTWLHMAICNTAMSGYFSSDRTIEEYAKNIWRIQPVIVGRKR